MLLPFLPSVLSKKPVPLIAHFLCFSCVKKRMAKAASREIGDIRQERPLKWTAHRHMPRRHWNELTYIGCESRLSGPGVLRSAAGHPMARAEGIST